MQKGREKSALERTGALDRICFRRLKLVWLQLLDQQSRQQTGVVLKGHKSWHTEECIFEGRKRLQGETASVSHASESEVEGTQISSLDRQILYHQKSRDQEVAAS